MITVVGVVGEGSDNDALVVYKDDIKIGYLAPTPNYGSLEQIIQGVTGEKPVTINVKQTAKPYPASLAEMKTWPNL